MLATRAVARGPSCLDCQHAICLPIDCVHPPSSGTMTSGPPRAELTLDDIARPVAAQPDREDQGQSGMDKKPESFPPGEVSTHRKRSLSSGRSVRRHPGFRVISPATGSPGALRRVGAHRHRVPLQIVSPGSTSRASPEGRAESERDQQRKILAATLVPRRAWPGTGAGRSSDLRAGVSGLLIGPVPHGADQQWQ